MSFRPFAAAIAAACLACVCAGAAGAQQGAPSWAGKTSRMIIGFGVGGGNDSWGRLVARHIGDHLPGKPAFIPENMPGAGSFVAANYLYNVAPKDGAVIGLIGRDAALGPITRAEGAHFDPLTFAWLGTPTTETNVCFAMDSAPVKSVEDLRSRELLVGDPGPGVGGHVYPRALNEILGTRFKPISGYESSSAVFLAMERGEVDGFCESLDSIHGKRPDWIRQGKVRLLLQGGLEPNPELKDVPFALDLARTEEEKELLRFLYAGQAIGRPFVAPPGLPEETLAALRKAFDETMADPAFIADVQKLKMDLEPVSGPALEKIVQELYATPKPLVERMTDIIRQ